MREHVRSGFLIGRVALAVGYPLVAPLVQVALASAPPGFLYACPHIHWVAWVAFRIPKEEGFQ